MKRDYLAEMREGKALGFNEQVMLILKLALPAILAQISSIVMQYIDASMVGRLGAEGSASIGLVSSSTWLFGGVNRAIAIGFTVQVAQLIGAGEQRKARNVMKQSYFFCVGFSLILMCIAVALSKPLPIILGGNTDIIADATKYFMVYGFALPFVELMEVSGGMLQASGNMKVPSLLHVMMCCLDVVFNWVFIYGMGLGVMGAALGTAAAEVVTAFSMMFFQLVKSPVLKLRKDEKLKFEKTTAKRAATIAVPVAFEQIITTGAQVMSTRIIAPLGTVAIAANSFGVTAEALCYMPGYGIASAATTLIGQSIGAKRNDLTKRLGWMATILGMLIMAITGGIMFVASPLVIGLLSTDAAVVSLAIKCLRIELFAEPLFGASIVANGVFRGAGKTLAPSIMNFVSMWGIRITLSLVLTKTMGLQGAWIGMAVQLSILGIVFLIRLAGKRWLPKRVECAFDA